MTPHQTETNILAFSVAFLLGLITSSVIDWAFRENPKPYTTVYEGQEITIRFHETK